MHAAPCLKSFVLSLVLALPALPAWSGPADTPSARWVGRYGGASLGIGSGTVTGGGAGGTVDPTRCNVGGTLYPVANSTLFGPGAIILQMPRMPSSPPGTSYYINVGYGVSPAKLGLVANGSPITTQLGGAYVPTLGTYRTDTVQVQTLGYGPGGPIAALDGRKTITVGNTSQPNPYTCMILLANGKETEPPGTVAVDFLNGASVLDTNRFGQGNFATLGGGAGGSAHLSGPALSGLVGVNFPLGPHAVWGVEGRGFLADIKGGGNALRSLVVGQARIGFAGPDTLVFFGAGIGVGTLATPGGSATEVVPALSTGIEYALGPRTALRTDVTWVRFTPRTIAGVRTSADVAITSIGIIWRF